MCISRLQQDKAANFSETKDAAADRQNHLHTCYMNEFGGYVILASPTFRWIK